MTTNVFVWFSLNILWVRCNICGLWKKSECVCASLVRIFISSIWNCIICICITCIISGRWKKYECVQGLYWGYRSEPSNHMRPWLMISRKESNTFCSLSSKITEFDTLQMPYTTCIWNINQGSEKIEEGTNRSYLLCYPLINQTTHHPCCRGSSPHLNLNWRWNVKINGYWKYVPVASLKIHHILKKIMMILKQNLKIPHPADF